MCCAEKDASKARNMKRKQTDRDIFVTEEDDKC